MSVDLKLQRESSNHLVI